jgi:hypothetical protein
VFAALVFAGRAIEITGFDVIPLVRSATSSYLMPELGSTPAKSASFNCLCNFPISDLNITVTGEFSSQKFHRSVQQAEE